MITIRAQIFKIFLFQIFKKRLKSEQENILEQDLSKIDRTLISSLMPFQQEGVW